MNKILALPILAVIALAGCEGSIETNLTVLGPGKVAASVTVKLDELTSEAVIAKPQLDQQIMSTMATISSQPVQRSYQDNILSYTVRAVPSELPGDIVGISNIAVGSKNENLVTSLTLTAPTKLVESLNKAFENEPDSAALSLTWQKSIKYTLTVETPGDIVLYSPEFTASGNTASISYYLVDWPNDKTVSIESSPPSSPWTLLLIGGLFIIILLAGVVVVFRKMSS